MFTVDGMRLLYAWANDSLDVLAAHLRTLPTEAMAIEVPGFGHPTVRHQLIHMLSVESAWLCGLRNVPITRPPVDENATLAAILEARARINAFTLEYIKGLTPLSLNADVAPLPADWIGPPRSPAFILAHVVTHAFHHKGQIVAMLRILGYPAPDTDLQRAT